MNCDIGVPEKHWEFLDDEKAILRNVDKAFQWLVRDVDGSLWLYCNKPKKDTHSYLIGDGNYAEPLSLYTHIFKDVKWEDGAPCEFRKYV